MALLPLGVLWFFATTAGGFIYLVASPVGTTLSLVELAAGAVPVGTLAAAWSVYIIAGRVSSLACVAGLQWH